ncbi:hypothetical protein [Polaribacter sejongensis]
MISRKQFADIDKEIKDSIEESLDKLKTEDFSNYILFLADAQYVENNNSNLDPFCIDYRIDGYQDSTRIEFLSQFLTNYYSFPENTLSTDDNSYRMNIELMVYTHVWESKSFLKKLYRLAHLNNNEEYDWDVNVPPMGKHDFIIDKIRKVFNNNNLKIWEVIKKGFHTSLRNAFAHSEYSFDRMNNNNRINLYNYGGKKWELQTITFDEWSLRFVYSALLGYHFLKIIMERRLNLIEQNDTDIFTIKYPKKSKNFIDRKIKYSQNGNGFSFVHE